MPNLRDLDTLPLLDESFPLPLETPFTTAQARAQGVTSNQLTRLVSTGLLRRLVQGVYVAAQTPDSLHLRAEALRLVVPADGVVTDRTAGWLHGASMVLAPDAHLVVPPVSVFMPVEGLRLRNKICASGERRLSARDITVVKGIRATTPLRTACDLGRLLHRDQALAALDALLRLGDFTLERLLEEQHRFRGFRGVVQLRHLAPLADPRAESLGESVLRLRWHDCGLPKPRPQIPVPGPGGSTYWLDLGLEDLRFAAEYDGEEFHGEEHREHDEARRDWIRRTSRYTIVVVRRRNVFGQHQDVDQILHAGVRAARRALGR